MDRPGAGVLPMAALRAQLGVLGVPDWRQRRMLRQARRLRFVRDLPWRSGLHLELASAARVAIALGCPRVGSAALLDVRRLLSSSWRANLWAAWIASLGGRPMSRDRMFELTGVPPRTQSHLERQAGVKARPNLARTALPADHLTGLRDAGRRSAYVRRDGRVGWHLPHIRNAPRWTARARRGRMRKHNRQVMSASCMLARGPDQICRLFFPSTPSAERAVRRGPSEAAELYGLVAALPALNLWSPVPVLPIDAGRMS